MSTRLHRIKIALCFAAALCGPLTGAVAQTNRTLGAVASWGEEWLTYAQAGRCFTAVAAGGFHSLALQCDGSVVAWGWNAGGQSDVPQNLNGVLAIAAGSVHSLALKSDGTVVAWGNNGDRQSAVPPDLSGVTAIAAGPSHNLALKSDGTVVAWGRNWSGQTNVPAGLGGVVGVAAADGASFALKSDGTLVAWGRSMVPAGLSGILSIASGYDHILALRFNGTVVAYGQNDQGQCTVPAGLSGVIALAAGVVHSLALKSDGTVVAWGSNQDGQTAVPPGLAGVIAIAAGNGHSLALRSDGSVVAWGENSDGQRVVPGSLSDVSAVSASSHNCLALRSDGTVVSWGYNMYGGDLVQPGLAGVTAIAAGGGHSLALKSNGTVVAWGWNAFGQSTVPVDLSGVIAIAAGYGHSLARQSDGIVIAWGWNGWGQTNVPRGLGGVVAIAAGDMYSLALKSDGTVIAWGYNGDGETNVPPNLNGVCAIAAGAYHSLALRSNGTVIAWGENSHGQTNVPAGLNGVLAIAAGRLHSLALKSDGRVVAWGSNDENQANPPTGLSGVAAIAAGYSFSLAIVTNSPTTQAMPGSQTAESGSTVSFRAPVERVLPTTYQWFFNNSEAIGSTSTNAHLTIRNVQLSQSGAYSVVLSNAAGLVTSAPAMLMVISPVEKKMVPGLILMAQPGRSLNLEFADDLCPPATWTRLATVTLTDASQWYFDLSSSLLGQRFYRAWHTGGFPGVPALDLHLVPAIILSGQAGTSVRLEYLDKVDPTRPWLTLATVTLTNTPQLYFDTAAPFHPPRVYRLARFAPKPFWNLNFDSATPGSPYTSVAVALPGWGAYVGGRPFFDAFYNGIPMDSSYVGIIDTNAPPPIPLMPRAIAGAYTAYLAAGYGGDTWLIQTSMIPTNAAAMCFYTGTATDGFGVALNGQNQPLRSLGSGTNYRYWGVDVAGFAGRVAELRFSVASQWPSPIGAYVVYLDKVTFSSTPLPAVSETKGAESRASGL